MDRSAERPVVRADLPGYGVDRSAERTAVRADLPGNGVDRSAERTAVRADLPGYGVADGLADACALRPAGGGSLGMGGGK